MTETQPVQQTPARNPHHIALLVIALVLALTAGVCWYIGVSQQADYSADAQQVLGFYGTANNLAAGAFLALVAWLVVSAVTWKRPGQ